MEIPLCKTYTNEKELNAVKNVLDSGWLAHGPKNQEFEKLFSEFIGTEYASCFNSGASALLAAILAQDLKGEVILPSFTFTASANAIVLAGCTPVFADINPITFNLDPENFKQKITNKTVGVMPVHYAGQICDMEQILEISEKNNIVIIEDSAETLGAELNGKKSGSFGLGCFSFYPTKNITTGEGGIITFDDAYLKDKIDSIKSHGLVKPTFERIERIKSWHRDAIRPGFNFRMSDLNAAIGIEQLKKINEINKMRRDNSQYLNNQLKNSVGGYIDVPEVKDINKHVYQMYVIKLREVSKRDLLIKYLKERGIGASVHFEPPVHMQTYYKRCFPSKLPITERVSKSVITLPMFPSIKREELQYMVNTIKMFFNG